MFEDPVETDRLRALRAAALAQAEFSPSIPVTDAGVAYQLFVRDELPSSASGAIDAFRDAVRAMQAP